MVAPPWVPSLPLRADVLQVNALFEELVDDGISEEFLRQYTGRDDLQEIGTLELQVDAVSRAQRAEMLGELLPRLLQLKLSQSRICTVRDLGTSLQNLKVLWLCRSQLQDLGGITNMPVLEELYVAFNDIRDLSPLWMHETLQVLDLEGNLIEDFEEVRALQAVPSLRDLNLSLNPVWKKEGFTRERVLDTLPSLEVLDDIPRLGAAAAKVVNGVPRCGASTPSTGPEGGTSGAGTPLPPEDAGELLAEEPPCRAVQELRRRAASASPTPSGGAEALARGAHSECVADSPSRRASPLGHDGRGTDAEAAAACRGGTLLPRAPPTGAPAGRAAVRRGAATERTDRSRAAAAAHDVRGGATELSLCGTLEPSEQDLVVEGLKRASRPVPSLWGWSKSARGDFAGSTNYRPATASSCRSTATSGGSVMSMMWTGASTGDFEVAAGSDLTIGGDGSALVGNPLEAVRRRRGGGGSGAGAAEGELGIRCLLQRYQGPTVERSRPQTPDVRVRRQCSVGPQHLWTPRPSGEVLAAARAPTPRTPRLGRDAAASPVAAAMGSRAASPREPTEPTAAASPTPRPPLVGPPARQPQAASQPAAAPHPPAAPQPPSGRRPPSTRPSAKPRSAAQKESPSFSAGEADVLLIN